MNHMGLRLSMILNSSLKPRLIVIYFHLKGWIQTEYTKLSLEEVIFAQERIQCQDFIW
jgi:hypothetical protein